MDKIINRVCSISNHPVAIMDDRMRITYVRCLGSMLYKLSRDAFFMDRPIKMPIAKMFYTTWARSIIGDNGNINIENYWKYDKASTWRDLRTLKKAFRFFWMFKKDFSFLYMLFFDIFYQRKIWEYALDVKPRIQNIIPKRFPRKPLIEVGDFFIKDKQCDKIPNALTSHYETWCSFIDKPLKKVLVVGNVSSGKSTLINALIGYNVNKVKNLACTSRLTSLYNKPIQDGITLEVNEGTSEKYEHRNKMGLADDGEFSEIGIHFNSRLSRYHICIVDTPGVNNSRASVHENITKEAIKGNDYDALVYVSDCVYSSSIDENAIMTYIVKHTLKPVIYVINKLDKCDPEEDDIRAIIVGLTCDLAKIGVANPVIVPLSARAAFLMKMDYDDMGEMSKRDRENLERQFSDAYYGDYYDLASYVGRKSDNMLDMTGITNLEGVIMNYLK